MLTDRFRHRRGVKCLARHTSFFSFSALRCIVDPFFVLIPSSVLRRDSRSHRQSGGSIIGAKGCVTKKIVYRKHNRPGSALAEKKATGILVHNGGWERKKTSRSKAIAKLLMTTKGKKNRQSSTVQSCALISVTATLFRSRGTVEMLRLAHLFFKKRRILPLI